MGLVIMRRTNVFIFLIACMTILVLFIFSADVNRDEVVFVPPIPPDAVLTDGTNSAAGSANINNWYYRGNDNVFYTYQKTDSVSEDSNESSVSGGPNGNFTNEGSNEDSIGMGSGIGSSNDGVIDDAGINKQQVLLYNGSLILDFVDNTGKYSQYPYPDKLSLEIFHKDNMIFQDNDIAINDADGDENGSASEQTSKQENDLENDMPQLLLSEFTYPIYQLYQPKENGELLYKVTAFWDESKASNRGFYGEVVYEFSFFNDVPIEFEVSSYESFPGELVTIFAKYADEDEKITLISDLAEPEIPFYKQENGQIAILPLSYYLQPADYIINLKVEQEAESEKEDEMEQEGEIEKAGEISRVQAKEVKAGDAGQKEEVVQNKTESNEREESKGKTEQIAENKKAENNLSDSIKYYEIIVRVLDKDFPIQYLTVSEELDESTRNDAAYEEYDKYVGAVRKTNTPVKMWDGVFLKPVEGMITTEFGMRRFVNDAPTSYRHSGIDIAAERGTPVKATNSGRVILARHLILTGNTVLIDHGYGIISWSYHMDSIQVKEGDDLIKGQIIGTVGSTGFSTGPHLHFAISVHDIFTNPWTLFEHEPAEIIF